MENYLAHIQRDLSGTIIAVQSVTEHCRNTARYADQALEPVSLSAAGYLAGLVHDAGKYTAAFQDYLAGQAGRRGSVNHTFTGVRLLLERYFRAEAEDFSGLTSELLAIASGGHHGLFDCVDERQRSGFQHRLTKEGVGYEEAEENFFRLCATPEELDRRELLTETWASPIIVTTLVQLLNTLFSGKTTAIRRFHALCGSIIIIDEVQTVPSKLLTLFSLAVNFLTEVCGATVVLSSATQPCMERIEHPLHTPIPDLVPYDPQLWAVFRRTDLQNAGSMSLEEIARFARERLEEADSLLIVCNKKDQSEKLFGLLEGGAFALFHLSAAMCVQHRRDTLEGLRASLERGRKTVCVSTQVIEAGVDISFSQVIRLTAGMDSVIQAAGRCNRGGEAGPGVLAPVYLIQCQGESLGRLPDILRGQEAAGELLQEFSLHPERYQERLEQAKPYTVSLYQYQIDRLNAEHSLIPLQGGALGLSGHYSEQTGFSMGASNSDFLWR